MKRQRDDPTDAGVHVSIVIGTVRLQIPAVIAQPSLDSAGSYLDVYSFAHS